jgi:hypothetical protein
VLTRDEKVSISPIAKALRDPIAALLPRIKLLVLLIEVDTWVRLRQHFTHPYTDQGQFWPTHLCPSRMDLGNCAAREDHRRTARAAQK